MGPAAASRWDPSRARRCVCRSAVSSSRSLLMAGRWYHGSFFRSVALNSLAILRSISSLTPLHRCSGGELTFVLRRRRQDNARHATAASAGGRHQTRPWGRPLWPASYGLKHDLMPGDGRRRRRIVEQLEQLGLVRIAALGRARAITIQIEQFFRNIRRCSLGDMEARLSLAKLFSAHECANHFANVGYAT